MYFENAMVEGEDRNANCLLLSCCSFHFFVAFNLNLTLNCVDIEHGVECCCFAIWRLFFLISRTQSFITYIFFSLFSLFALLFVYSSMDWLPCELCELGWLFGFVSLDLWGKILSWIGDFKFFLLSISNRLIFGVKWLRNERTNAWIMGWLLEIDVWCRLKCYFVICKSIVFKNKS